MEKRGFTHDQHIDLGRRLKEARRILLPLSIEVANEVGSTSKCYRRAARAVERLDELRSELDNVLCRDFPDRDYRGVYYGGR